MKQKEVKGAIVKVPIDQDTHTYARIIHNHCYAFYDYRTTVDLKDFAELAKVLFILLVHKAAIQKDGWTIVGVDTIPEELNKPVQFFIQVIGNKEICWLDVDGERKRVDCAECENIERLAVWDAIHVESRLQDHYNGKENNFLLGLKLRR